MHSSHWAVEHFKGAMRCRTSSSRTSAPPPGIESIPAATGPTPSFFSHLAGLYSSPTQEFKRILPRPRFWVPMLLGMALNLGFTGIWLSKVDPHEFMKNAM